ncbi:hypothetical protein [Flavobacterium limi]|uniref:Uncharacterized protein n=1 Tax=Flavobacterium limi TaxID=2045105 RepID=A0ABQ1UVP4_9FLAO|nr:hypothetical protein [Flavobacterium limi]GGF28130.1 hypothetical protein GCM10011518_41810 [Flavobacterium limi]
MKNSDTPQSPSQNNGNSQNQGKDPKNSDMNRSPYDSENLDKESNAGSKDITEKDTQKDLLENDPSQGFETDVDKPESSGDENDAFEMTWSDRDNPINKEFQIGQLGNEELQQDELTRDESEGGHAPFHKPSERKF